MYLGICTQRSAYSSLLIPLAKIKCNQIQTFLSFSSYKEKGMLGMFSHIFHRFPPLFPILVFSFKSIQFFPTYYKKCQDKKSPDDTMPEYFSALLSWSTHWHLRFPYFYSVLHFSWSFLIISLSSFILKSCPYKFAWYRGFGSFIF